MATNDADPASDGSPSAEDAPPPMESMESEELTRLIQPEDIWPEEWVEWFRLTPRERWLETGKLWEIYLSLGGSLDPEPDSQSPFFDADEWSADAADGRPGLRAIRRSGV